MPDSMDLCQGSVPATGSANKSISAPQNETHEEPGSNEEMREGATSDEEPLPRPPSPDQIQQSAELEPFIPPTKQTASLSSTACVSTSTPRTLIPAKARSLLRVWRLEAASLLLSFSCFILIIVVLAHFDQKGLPDWPLSITLNSFLAFFTTLIKATFMLPVSTAISQTKWSWFLQDRPMYDFHILDQASRGVRGSFMLLWRAHFRSFVSLGACIVIISTLTSPVTQLAINYPMRDREVPRGAYARAIRKIETPTDALAHATSKAVQLAIALTSWVAAKYEDLDMSTRITLTMTPSDFIQSLWTLVLFHPHAMLNHTARYNCLNNIYLNVATALSSVIRRADLDYTEHGFNVTGKAWEAETYVQIRWGWLSFLAFELVLATSLLAMTIATQKHNQKSDRESYDMVCDLKDSSLAALVALNNDSRGVVGDGLGPISGLEKTAKEVHVRLRGNRLVAVDPAHETRCDSA
ncbi:hypothetical protein BHE90_000647 [Fusarium euwallaceae]|uniref:Uncharacterized protein n=1 Tax=Fusarium euwallaceae TaxID=1147111 RepID=A0A430MA10_9HYPO|nr:hypothetical protein BHE90_000647 [Fusarium euwallaceae]